MAGTVEGGKKTAAANLAKDPDFYKKIGAIGGRNGTTGGFAANPELARIAGQKGGKVSSRAGIKTGQGKRYRGDKPVETVDTAKPNFLRRFLKHERA